MTLKTKEPHINSAIIIKSCNENFANINRDLNLQREKIKKIMQLAKANLERKNQREKANLIENIAAVIAEIEEFIRDIYIKLAQQQHILLKLRQKHKAVSQSNKLQEIEPTNSMYKKRNPIAQDDFYWQIVNLLQLFQQQFPLIHKIIHELSKLRHIEHIWRGVSITPITSVEPSSLFQTSMLAHTTDLTPSAPLAYKDAVLPPSYSPPALPPTYHKTLAPPSYQESLAHAVYFDPAAPVLEPSAPPAYEEFVSPPPYTELTTPPPAYQEKMAPPAYQEAHSHTVNAEPSAPVLEPLAPPAYQEVNEPSAYAESTTPPPAYQETTTASAPRLTDLLSENLVLSAELMTKANNPASHNPTIEIINPNATQHSKRSLPSIAECKANILMDMSILERVLQQPRPTLDISIRQIASRIHDHRKNLKDWHLRIQAQRQSQYDQAVQLRQAIIENKSLSGEDLKQCHQTLHELNIQEAHLHDLHALLIRQQVLLNCLLKPEKSIMALTPQAVKEIAIMLNSQASEASHVQAQIAAIHEDIAAIPLHYEHSLEGEGRLVFLQNLPQRIRKNENQLDELERLCKLQLRDIEHYQEVLMMGRDTEQLKHFSQYLARQGISIETIRQLQESSTRARNKLVQQIANLNLARAQLNAQKNWLEQLHEAIPTAEDLPFIDDVLNNNNQQITSLQRQLNQTQKHLQQNDQQSMSHQELHDFIAKERESLAEIKKLIQHTKQELQALMVRFGDLNAQEIELLSKQKVEPEHNDTTPPKMATAEQIFAQQAQIAGQIAQLNQQLEQAVAMEHKLDRLDNWLNICSLATTEKQLKNLTKIVDNVTKHLLNLTNNELSAKSIQQKTEQINSIVIQGNHKKSATTWEQLHRQLLNELIHADELQRKLNVDRQYLNKVLHQLGGNCTFEQLTNDPLGMQPDLAHRILQLRHHAKEQQYQIDLLLRNLDYLKKCVQQKLQAVKMQNSEQKNEVKNSPHLAMQPIVNPNKLSANKKCFYCRNNLVIEASSLMLRFTPQSYLPAHQRRAILDENVQDYTLANEADAIREMINQALANHWGPLQIRGGILPGQYDFNRYYLLMVAVARADLTIGVDWQYLQDTNFKTNPMYQQIRAFEEHLLNQGHQQPQHYLPAIDDAASDPLLEMPKAPEAAPAAVYQSAHV